MLHWSQRRTLTLSTLAAAMLASLSSLAGSWQDNINYGGSMSADLYVPDAPAESAPILVVLHYCGGQKRNVKPWAESYADMHGFYIVVPKAGGSCFDASPQRSGERADVVAMVQYTVDNHGADPTRVFAGGESSGACMTQALLAAYPEVFAGGASLAGVPAGAWTGGNGYGWSAPRQSAEAWGNKVREANPGFSGPWPRIQLWHGEGDTNLKYNDNHPAAVAQWTNVWGLSVDSGTTTTVKPPGAKSTWNRTTYSNDSGVVVVEANSGPGVSHNMSVEKLWGDVVRFFALDQPAATVPPPPEPPVAGGAAGAGGAGGALGTGGRGGNEAQGGAPGAAGMGGMPGGGAAPTPEGNDAELPEGGKGGLPGGDIEVPDALPGTADNPSTPETPSGPDTPTPSAVANGGGGSPGNTMVPTPESNSAATPPASSASNGVSTSQPGMAGAPGPSPSSTDSMAQSSGGCTIAGDDHGRQAELLFLSLCLLGIALRRRQHLPPEETSSAQKQTDTRS